MRCKAKSEHIQEFAELCDTLLCIIKNFICDVKNSLLFLKLQFNLTEKGLNSKNYITIGRAHFENTIQKLNKIMFNWISTNIT